MGLAQARPNKADSSHNICIYFYPTYTMQVWATDTPLVHEVRGKTQLLQGIYIYIYIGASLNYTDHTLRCKKARRARGLDSLECIYMHKE